MSNPVTDVTAPQEAAPSLTYWQRVLRDFRRNTMAMLGFGLVLIVTLTGIFAPLLANSRPHYIKAVFEDQYDEDYFIVLDSVEQLLAGAEDPQASSDVDYAAALTRALTDMAPSLDAEKSARLK